MSREEVKGYNYAMSKTIVFRFATPDPLKYEISSGVGKAKQVRVKRREWDGEKLLAYLQEHLPGIFESRFPDHSLRIEQARKSDIALEGWRPGKEESDEVKQAFDELVGEVLADIEVEDFLLS